MADANKNPDGSGNDPQNKLSDLEKQLGKKLSPEDLEFLKGSMGNAELLLQLRDTKRSANEEAKKYRLELEKQKDDKRQKEIDEQKSQGKYKGLYENTDTELKQTKAELFALRRNTKLKSYAGSFNLIDEDDVIHINENDLDYDENGNMKFESVQQAFSNLYKAKPFKFKQGDKGKADDRKPGGASKLTDAKEIAIDSVMSA